MKVRSVQSRDIEPLRAMAAASGFPYIEPNGPRIESAFVVEDDSGQIVMAAAAEAITQLYLWAASERHPAVKMAALRMLHQAMASHLKELGYNETNVFLPPQIEKSFGGRLQRSFGWKPNWKSWFLRF